MRIEITKSDPNLNFFSLPVSYDNMDKDHVITVGAGSFRIGSVNYELQEDEIFSVPMEEDSTEDVTYFGHMVSTQDGEVHLLFDRVSMSDPIFDFSKSNLRDLGTFVIMKPNGMDYPEIVVRQILDDNYVDEEEANRNTISDFYKNIGMLT